jgi:hypothetical protein
MRSVVSRVCGLLLVIVPIWRPTTAHAGDANLPDLGPIVISVFPLGAKQGETVEVEISGRNLADTRSIDFARPDIKGTILSSDFFSIKARVSVGPNVPVGLHDYRLRTPRGTHVGVIHVGALPRLMEKEPNNDLKQAQKIQLPSMIDGVVEVDDYDVFRFHAEAGQTVIFDVLSTRAGTRFDSTLTLLDERGAEIEFVDDYYIQKDPHLSFRVKKSGEYFIRVAGATEPITGLFDGTPYSSYRLIAGVVPYMLHALPAGLRRGSSNKFRIAGENLQKIDRLVLGESLVTGKVVAAAPDSLEVQIDVPASVPLCRFHGGTVGASGCRFGLGGAALREGTIASQASRDRYPLGGQRSFRPAAGR